MLVTTIFSVCVLERSLPVVGKVDHRLLAFSPHNLNLIFGSQHRLGVGSIQILLAGRIPHAQLDRTRVALFTIRAEVLKEQRILPVAIHGMRTIKHTLSPPSLAAVDGIGSVVFGKSVIPAIQVVDDAVFDTVGDTADGSTEMWCVVFGVVFLGIEAQDDVLTGDAEFLDDGPEGEEGERGFVTHGVRGGIWERERERENACEKRKKGEMKWDEAIRGAMTSHRNIPAIYTGLPRNREPIYRATGNGYINIYIYLYLNKYNAVRKYKMTQIPNSGYESVPRI